MPISTETLKNRINDLLPEVLALRHDLHRHPELAYEEQRTGSKVLEFLSGVPGLDICEGLGGTGLAITLGKELAGPCVALRADMDALPINETSGVEWSSTVPGKMHACGHDGHTAMLAGAVRVMAGLRDELAGPVKFIFQPAEEGGAGAKRMCNDGVLSNPDVAAVFGLHNNLPDPAMKIGTIAYVQGAAMAGTGNFDIEVVGRGGHAAFPHKTIDPIYVGSCIVDQLQGIVGRNIDPLVPAVVSVTRFQAGSAYNIIPGTARLSGTLRALDQKVLEHLRDLLIQRAGQVAEAHGARIEVDCRLSYPVLVNDPRAEAAFLEILDQTGDTGAIVRTSPILGGEDFAFFGEQVPAFFYFLPSCPPDEESNPVCHHPSFDFNDALLPDGIRLHVELGRRFARIWKT
ncbi:MAG: M20 metallopeptidase family protein [Opitutales bacterium]|jgi:amidohydrolase